MHAIEVKNISKSFSISHEKNSSVRSLFSQGIKHTKKDTFHALKDINFSVNKGEFFGILGRNGSGKSTLLKILSNIYVPDQGTISISGKLSPFLELGVGFHEELTGRENIFMYGALLGLSQKEIHRKFQDIVAFAGLERFIDTKLKNYSSGMSVRLAFSVAVQADADIYILDEVLAVGDANFQEKCYQVFDRFKKEGKTIILVSHALENIERFADRAMIIEEGQIYDMGDPKEMTFKYYLLNLPENERQKILQEKADMQLRIAEEQKEKIRQKNNNMTATKRVIIENIEILDEKDTASSNFMTGGSMKVRLSYKAQHSIAKPNFAFTIFRKEDDLYIYDTNTDLDNQLPKVESLQQDGVVTLIYANLPLHAGTYYLRCAIYSNYGEELHDMVEFGPEFTISSEKPQFGVIHLEHSWDIKKIY